jgi:hypothetical protein
MIENGITIVVFSKKNNYFVTKTYGSELTSTQYRSIDVAIKEVIFVNEKKRS